jgi:F0F1-type ATP synthase membrane subunit b/b'
MNQPKPQGDVSQSASAKPESAGEDSGQKLHEALSTVADAVVGGQLEDIRKLVKTVQSDLSKRIDSEVGSTKTGLSTKVEELLRKLEEANKARTKELTDLDQRMKQTLEDMKDQMRKVGEQAKKDATGLRRELEKQIAQNGEALDEKIASIAGGLATAQLGLQQQAEATERATALLNNLAGVFSGQVAAAGANVSLESVGSNGSNGDSPPPERSDSNESAKDVQDALDKVFSG